MFLKILVFYFGKILIYAFPKLSANLGGESVLESGLPQIKIIKHQALPLWKPTNVSILDFQRGFSACHVRKEQKVSAGLFVFQLEPEVRHIPQRHLLTSGLHVLLDLLMN